MITELMESLIKEVKEGMMTTFNQIENINKEVKMIIKKNKMEIWGLKSIYEIWYLVSLKLWVLITPIPGLVTAIWFFKFV